MGVILAVNAAPHFGLFASEIRWTACASKNERGPPCTFTIGGPAHYDALLFTRVYESLAQANGEIKIEIVVVCPDQLDGRANLSLWRPSICVTRTKSRIGSPVCLSR